MEQRGQQQNRFRAGRWGILHLLILPGLCLALLLFARRWEDAACRRREGEIRRALAYAYAAEGAYPDSFSALEQYGIRVDEEAYLVRYLPLGENIMPDVQVIRRGRRP